MACILLVEDSTSLNRALALRLQHAGHDVTGVFSASEALAAAPTVDPDLAILDVNLPDGNGIDLAAQLRELLPGLTLVFASANRDPELERRARAAGAFQLLSKPFDASLLLDTVHRACAAPMPPAAAS